MSALGKLIGVGRVGCQRKGHFCQAQMWLENEPVCLRCTNGEPCYRETADALETPERYEDNRADLCVVPELDARSIAPRKHRVTVRPPKFTGNEACKIRRMLLERSLDQVAAMLCLEPCMIERFTCQAPVSGEMLAAK
jgi:hypothetical protein